jgi:hypothetical protein
MAESERKAELPTLLVVILALLGITTFRGGWSPGPDSGGDTSRGAAAKQTRIKPAPAGHQADGASDQATQILRPLAVHLGLENDAKLTVQAVEQRIRERSQARSKPAYTSDSGIRCLIVTVPDPIRTTNSHRFDETVDAVQRAVETQGYALDGYRIAWQDAAPPAPAPAQSEAEDAEDSPTSSRPPEGRQPGTLLFRRSQGAGLLLLVFLVPESATQGLDRRCLIDSLNLAKDWDGRNRSASATEKAQPKPAFSGRYNILGPCFSGSQPSLEQGLRDWLAQPGGTRSGRIAFHVVSGMASSIDVGRLKAAAECSGHVLSFHATVHRTEAILKGLLAYVGQGAGDAQIAFLTESDTGFGQSSISGLGHATGAVSYRFPSHISQLRSSYDRERVFGNDQTKTIRSAERLTIPDGESEPAEDVIALRTPGYSAAIDELTLDQILTDIARRKIRKVGIIATDPRDVIFLAREVNRFCDDVQLFTPLDNLLFVHPQYAADLRGMLVGATYPLYPRNQLWSDEGGQGGEKRPQLAFPSNESQGVYNATVAQLLAMGSGIFAPDCFLEYGIPFAQGEESRRGLDPRVPPVWIGVVGNRGIYPVRANSLPIDGDKIFPKEYYHYLYRRLPPTARSSAAGSSAPYQPEFEVFWLILFIGLTLTGIALAAAALLALYWACTRTSDDPPASFALGPVPLVWLAEFLNLRRLQRSRGPETVPGASLRGMFWLVLVFLVGYGHITYPLLSEAARRPGWPGGSGVLAWLSVSIPALAVLLALLIAVCALALIPWRAPARDRDRSLRRFRRLLVLASVLALGVGVCAALAVERVRDDAAHDDLFRLERALIVTSGVSGVFPMFFLIVVAGALVFNRVNDLYLLAQHMPHYRPPGQERLGSDDPMWTTDCKLHDERFAFTSAVEKPSRCLLPRSFTQVVTVAVAGVYLVYFGLPLISPLLPGGASRSMEGRVFDLIFSLLAFCLFAFVILNTIRLTLMWKSLRRIIKLFLHLPVGPSLERMSTRVARWFFESPATDPTRFDLITRQARTLAELFELDFWASRHIDTETLRQKWASLLDALDKELVTADGSTWEDRWGTDRGFGAIWSRLRENLVSIRPETMFEVRAMLFPIVLAYWKMLSVEEAYPEIGSSEAEAAAPAREPEDDEAAPAGAPERRPDPRAAADLRFKAWGSAATDLLALVLVSWVAVAMALIWRRISGLVVAVLALLLAVDSYPFGFQDRMIFGLFLLAAYLVLVIIRIIVGVGREELIRRIATTAEGFKINTPLISSLLTYIVPLVGTVAALSFDLSDTLHTLFDPILRHLR